MPVNTLKELLRLRLGEMYNGEQEMLQLIDAVETETQSRLLRDRVRRQRDDARRHIAVLEKSFELLGTDPPRTSSPLVHALCEERRSIMREAPGPVAMEWYHLDMLARAAHYQSAAYQGLVDLACEIGQNDVRSLLERCRQDEAGAAVWMAEQRAGVMKEIRPPAPERAVATRPS